LESQILLGFLLILGLKDRYVGKIVERYMCTVLHRPRGDGPAPPIGGEGLLDVQGEDTPDITIRFFGYPWQSPSLGTSSTTSLYSPPTWSTYTLAMCDGIYSNCRIPIIINNCSISQRALPPWKLMGVTIPPFLIKL
jgi:hypothetical protein